MAHLQTRDEVEKVFNRIDADGDGKISPSELGEVVQAIGPGGSNSEVGKMMAEMDADRDGFVDLQEFTDFQARRSPMAAGEAELRDAFDMYDLDRDGAISAKELHSVMRRLGEKCSVRDCEQMIKNVDDDGDGKVCFEEFKKMMGKKVGYSSGA